MLNLSVSLTQMRYNRDMMYPFRECSVIVFRVLCICALGLLHTNSLLEGEARLESPRSPLGNSLLHFTRVECC